MLIAKNILKSYRDLQVLKGVDIHVAKSEIVSIVGASGAGKTTLLQILGTLDKPDSGDVIIAGQSTAELKGDALAHFRNKHIGFVFQFHNLLPEFTALENVCLPGYLEGKSHEECVHTAIKYFDLLGINHRSSNKPAQLSGGEQQRVSVARALMNNPSIIFADEPSGNLDSKNAEDLHSLFFRLRDELGQTFVIVTHNNGLADMADRKVEIVDGSIK